MSIQFVTENASKFWRTSAENFPPALQFVKTQAVRIKDLVICVLRWLGQLAGCAFTACVNHSFSWQEPAPPPSDSPNLSQPLQPLSAPDEPPAPTPSPTAAAAAAAATAVSAQSAPSQAFEPFPGGAAASSQPPTTAPIPPPASGWWRWWF